MFRIEEGKAGEDRIRGLSNDEFVSSFSRLLRGPGRSKSDSRGVDHVFSLYAREQLRRIEAGALGKDAPGASIHVVQKERLIEADAEDWCVINGACVSYWKNSGTLLPHVVVSLGVEWVRVEVGRNHRLERPYEMLYPRRTRTAFFYARDGRGQQMFCQIAFFDFAEDAEEFWYGDGVGERRG